LLDIINLLTLRYDPTTDDNNINDSLNKADGNIRHIDAQEVGRHRRRLQLLQQRQITNNNENNNNNIPSSKNIENILRQVINRKIEESKTNRIAVALSAGVDSILIFCLIRKEFPEMDIDCLTVSFNEDDSIEVPAAREIAESQNAGFHEIRVENLLKDLPTHISIIQEPRWNIYQHYFIEKARTISNVLFTGDGGDELFAGYIFRYKKFLANIKPNDSSWQDRVQTYLQCHERDWVPDQEDMFGVKLKKRFSWYSIYLLLKKYFDNGLDPLEQVLLADYHGKLMYDFIPTNEKYFKHFNIDGIAPLLYSEIIDLSIRIPAYLKYDLASNIGKIPLREIIKSNAITSASLSLPSRLIENKKVGFGIINLPKFWFKIGKETVTSNLEKGMIFEDKIISRDWYIKSLKRIDGNKDPRYIAKMLQLLSLEIWYKLFKSEINASSYVI
jgi:asparagine synthase (glutamine-hydrolysing)